VNILLPSTLRGLRLYIAGPMRGKKLYNFPLFFRTAIWLREECGVDAVNPAEIDMAAGLDPSLPLDHPDQIPFDIRETLRKDFLLILHSDGIVMLPGWEESLGASAERVVAQMSGRRVLFFDPTRDTLSESSSDLLNTPRIQFES
jgi:hypothetical protein